ncbi:MAG: lipoyl(octanoyl) transferase LipB [Desulfatiglandaceae bacterium]
MTQPWFMVDIPLMDYQDALDLQYALVQAKHSGILAPHVILLLEHPPVFTFGRRGGKEHLLVKEDFLERRGIKTFQVERGGYVTYHGPGQLVIYPIVDLKQIGWRVVDFVEALERVVIHLTADWGIQSERNPLNRGVWIGNRKLANIGLAVRHWITFHGVAVNVNPSLEPFTWMNPCGLKGIQITSLARELGQPISLDLVRERLKRHLKTQLGIEPVETSLAVVKKKVRRVFSLP